MPYSNISKVANVTENVANVTEMPTRVTLATNHEILKYCLLHNIYYKSYTPNKKDHVPFKMWLKIVCVQQKICL